jgi:hypothetical protein
MKVLLLLFAGTACGLLTYIAIQVSQPTDAAPPQVLPVPVTNPLQDLELALDLHITLDGDAGRATVRRNVPLEPGGAVTAGSAKVVGSKRGPLDIPRMESLDPGTVLKEYHPNGEIAFLGTRKLDEHSVWVRDGAWQSWHDNGQVDELGAYRDGVEDGPWQWWWPNGQRKAEGRFHHGLREGKWTFWHDNGQVLMEASYFEGQGTGHWTSYHENGLIWTDGDYVEGEISGRWRVWNDDGTPDLDRSGVYEKGERIGD